MRTHNNYCYLELPPVHYKSQGTSDQDKSTGGGDDLLVGAFRTLAFISFSSSIRAIIMGHIAFKINRCDQGIERKVWLTIIIMT